MSMSAIEQTAISRATLARAQQRSAQETLARVERQRDEALAIIEQFKRAVLALPEREQSRWLDILGGQQAPPNFEQWLKLIHDELVAVAKQMGQPDSHSYMLGVLEFWMASLLARASTVEEVQQEFIGGYHAQA